MSGKVKFMLTTERLKLKTELCSESRNVSNRNFTVVGEATLSTVTTNSILFLKIFSLVDS